MLDSRLLSVPEMARITGWSVVKIRSLCRQGKIPAVNSGTGKREVWFAPQGNLERYLSGELNTSQKQPSPSPKLRRVKTRIDSDVQDKRF